MFSATADRNYSLSAIDRNAFIFFFSFSYFHHALLSPSSAKILNLYTFFCSIHVFVASVFAIRMAHPLPEIASKCNRWTKYGMCRRRSLDHQSLSQSYQWCADDELPYSKHKTHSKRNNNNTNMMKKKKREIAAFCASIGCWPLPEWRKNSHADNDNANNSFNWQWGKNRKKNIYIWSIVHCHCRYSLLTNAPMRHALSLNLHLLICNERRCNCCTDPGML